jgi:transcriptional regulator with XRE-family HTH domain
MAPQDHPIFEAVELGGQIRLARLHERFSLRQLAAVTRIHRNRLWAIEHGAAPSSIERRIIGAALRVRL